MEAISTDHLKRVAISVEEFECPDCRFRSYCTAQCKDISGALVGIADAVAEGAVTAEQIAHRMMGKESDGKR